MSESRDSDSGGSESLVYSLKWKDSMKPKRKNKLRKSSKDQASPSLSEKSIQGRLRGKRQRSKVKKTQAADELSNDDILDIIDRKHQVKETHEENGPLLVEVADEGVEQRDDDEISVTSSVMSGPTSPYYIAEKQQLCTTCCKLYKKAKRMKAPLKPKLWDTNPKSLTCDQWVLLKPWRSKQKPNTRGNQVLTQLIHRLRLVKKDMKLSELAAEGQCSRQHLFLQRNLNCCRKVPPKKEKKKNRRKRSREDCQGPRVAKQQRLHNNQPRPISSSVTHSNSPGSVSSSSSVMLFDHENSDLTISVPSVSNTFGQKDLTKHSVPKRAGGFRDLLAQLRGNNSMIIRETR